MLLRSLIRPLFPFLLLIGCDGVGSDSEQRGGSGKADGFDDDDVELEPVPLLHYVLPKCGDYAFGVNTDGDFTLALNAYIVGAEQPGLFRLTATSPDGAKIASELVEYPAITVPAGPAQEQIRIDVEKKGSPGCWRANFVIESQPRLDEVGSCGARPRNRFIRWARSRVPWKGQVDYQFGGETLPPDGEYFRTSRCSGASCNPTNYQLVGSIETTDRTILQVRDLAGEFWDPLSELTWRHRTLLFFDHDGELRGEVDGELYYEMPDGNFLVSQAHRGWGDGDFGMVEVLASVSPMGGVNWVRYTDARPPLSVVTTAAGNLALSYYNNDYTVRRGGIMAIDPDTGEDAEETIVDRDFLCVPGLTRTDCAASATRVKGRFEDWWDGASEEYGSPTSEDHSVCNSTSCTTVTLQSWFVDGNEDVLEVQLHQLVLTGHGDRRFLNKILFLGGGNDRDTGGKIIRKRGPKQLLVSGGVADSGWHCGTCTTWYNAQESLFFVSDKGGWGIGVGPPALVGGADGFFLDGNRLFWTWIKDENGTGIVSQKIYDLGTGAVSDVPPPVVDEGLCVP